MDHQFVFLSKQTNKLVSAEQVNVWCFIRYSGRSIKRLPDLLALSGIILNYPFFYKRSQRFGTKIQLVFVPFLLQLFSLDSNAVLEPLHDQSLSCCDSSDVMGFLRFSALAGMPRRTSWLLNCLTNVILKFFYFAKPIQFRSGG